MRIPVLEKHRNTPIPRRGRSRATGRGLPILAEVIMWSGSAVGDVNLPAIYKAEIELVEDELEILVLVDSTNVSLLTRFPDRENEDYQNALDRKQSHRSFDIKLGEIVENDGGGQSERVSQAKTLLSRVKGGAKKVLRLENEVEDLRPERYEYGIMILCVCIFLGVVSRQLPRRWVRWLWGGGR